MRPVPVALIMAFACGVTACTLSASIPWALPVRLQTLAFVVMAVAASLATSWLLSHRSAKSLFAAGLVALFGYLTTQYLLGGELL